MASAQARRGQVAYAQRRGVSVRKACALLWVARSTLEYESRLAKRDAPVVAAMRELAAQYPRYGHRRIQVFLARRGHHMSADRTHRLWAAHGLQVPRKRPRRRVASTPPRPLQPTGVGQMWAYLQLRRGVAISASEGDCTAPVRLHGSVRFDRLDHAAEPIVAVIVTVLRERDPDAASVRRARRRDVAVEDVRRAVDDEHDLERL